MDIKTNRTEHELVGLCDGLTVLAILVSGQVEATADEVDVCGVDAEVLSSRYGTAEEVLDPWQLIELGLEGDILNPCLALCMLEKSHET